MSQKDLRDLFVYEAGLAISAEKLGDSMLSEIAYHATDRRLADLLHGEEGRRRVCLAEFESCFESIGGTPLDIPAPSVEALRTRFRDYLVLRRAPGVVDLFVLGTALRFMYLMITTYKELMSLSEHLGEDQCRQSFQNILRHKEEYIERFERHDRVLVESFSAAE